MVKLMQRVPQINWVKVKKDCTISLRIEIWKATIRPNINHVILLTNEIDIGKKLNRKKDKTKINVSKGIVWKRTELDTKKEYNKKKEIRNGAQDK